MLAVPEPPRLLSLPMQSYALHYYIRGKRLKLLKKKHFYIK